MAKEECQLCIDGNCLAQDLEPCDYVDNDFRKCLRYRVHNLKPGIMQLR